MSSSPDEDIAGEVADGCWRFVLVVAAIVAGLAGFVWLVVQLSK